jgi:hypothetical protein
VKRAKNPAGNPADIGYVSAKGLSAAGGEGSPKEFKANKRGTAIALKSPEEIKA